MSHHDTGGTLPTLDAPHEVSASNVRTGPIHSHSRLPELDNRHSYILRYPVIMRHTTATPPRRAAGATSRRATDTRHSPQPPTNHPGTAPDNGPHSAPHQEIMPDSAFPLPASLFWFYLLAVATIEAITVLSDLASGLVLYTGLLLTLTGHSVLGRRDETRKLALTLTLIPLSRMLALALPLMKLPQETWYAVLAAVLLVITTIMARQSGLPRRELGLHTRHAALHLLMLTGGLGLGTIQFAIFQPQPLNGTGNWGPLLLLTLLAVCITGFTEELIFRGLVQSLALRVMGRWGLLYGALIFAVLHIGYLSITGVVFAFLVGLLFAQIVSWSRSILGVSLVHGIANVMQLLLLPHLIQSTAGVASGALWLTVIGMVTPGIIPIILILMTIALGIVLLVLGYIGSLS